MQEDCVVGDDAAYVNWAAYDDRWYFLNADCIRPRTITFRGERLTLAPGELKEILR